MKFGFRELVFLMVLLAVPMASWWYVFKPRNTDIELARAEIEVKQARLDELRKVTDKIDDLGLAIERGREAIELIEAKLPSEQDVEGILSQMWQVAERNNLIVKSIKSDKPVPAATYMEQPLKMTMSGNFDGFYQFLLEMEQLPRITRIHQMKLFRAEEIRQSSPTKLADATGDMNAEFAVSIYFEPQTRKSE
jgi:type IV pilus assembly protein PilO